MAAFPFSAVVCLVRGEARGVVSAGARPTDERTNERRAMKMAGQDRRRSVVLCRMFLAGQGLALVITLMNVCVDQLVDEGFEATAFQSMFLYLAIVLVHGTAVMMRRRGGLQRQSVSLVEEDYHHHHQNHNQELEPIEDLGDHLALADSAECGIEETLSSGSSATAESNDNTRQVPHMKWFFLLALFDVAGNYFVVLAYQFTTIASATALDCFTIPCVAILSYFILGTRYNLFHISSVVVSLLGIGLIISSDILSKNSPGFNQAAVNAPLGDAFILMGAFCYALTNVFEEKIVKRATISGYLLRLATIAFFYSVVLSVIFERPRIQAINWTGRTIAFLCGYVASGLVFYTGVGLFIRTFDALLFNMSLLTSDVYAIIVSYVVLKQGSIYWLYFLGFFFVSVGVITYSLSDEAPRLCKRCNAT